MAEKFLKIEFLYSLLEIEPFVLIGALILITWIFYKAFLKEVSQERHKGLREHFRKLLKDFIILTVFFALFMALKQASHRLQDWVRIVPYLGFITFVWGNYVFVQTCRLLVLQYLFLGSMRHGVPRLMVNIFSLLLSTILLLWGISQVFGFSVAPLLATSAAFSLILGLALQETLGNLFAGISLQLDKSFEIGDWLEITSGLQKIIGQVKEISWRSTTLIGQSDEVTVLPNRFMAQAQISNFSPPDGPIIRHQLFRIQHGENVDLAKDVLEKSVAGISEVRGIPSPFAYLFEHTENWQVVKLVYFVNSYGSQFLIGDKVLRKGHAALATHKIKLARQVLHINSNNLEHVQPPPSP
ncbi:MAG: mechanosensitive ion channel family protein [Pseudobdellovibrionaceae bacterium]